MNGSTHAAVGLALGLLCWREQPLPAAFTLGCISTLTALLPDIDHPQSKYGRRLIIGALVFRHRGFTHSLIALALVMLACWHFVPGVIPLAVGVGYGSHLLIDMLNPQGIQLFYPLRWKVSLFRFRTGGLVDAALGFCAGLGGLVMLVWLLVGRGF